jgi:hypothetical protein
VTALPHDITDLYLAPVVLAVDARIKELGELGMAELAEQVALASDTADWTRDLREGALLDTVRIGIDCHHWDLSWDARGIRLTHESHELVLGIPASFIDYLAGASTRTGHAH